MVELINQLNADVVVFTGDALNSLDALPLFQETLGQIKANLGKYAVKGNYDIWCSSKANLFEGAGFEELNNRFVKLTKDGEDFFITGQNCCADWSTGHFWEKIPSDKFTIYLYHLPSVIESLKDFPVDLVLTGHIHGGQIALPLYGAVVTLSQTGKKFEWGLYHLKSTSLYVNRGLGMEGGIAPRIRLFAGPEIAVFDINPERD